MFLYNTKELVVKKNKFNENFIEGLSKFKANSLLIKCTNPATPTVLG